MEPQHRIQDILRGIHAMWGRNHAMWGRNHAMSGRIRAMPRRFKFPIPELLR